jgi:dihydroflavonol-4-reductase
MIAITGATGFLGSHLLQQAGQGGVDVCAVQRASTTRRDVEASCRIADLTDAAALRAAFAGCDTVIANAALAPGWSRPAPEQFTSVNVDGVENTVRAAAAAGVRRVVLVSSIAVYDTKLNTMIDERHPTRDPDSTAFTWSALTTNPHYTRSKAAGERLARTLCPQLGVELVIVRPGPLYGPGDLKATARYGSWNRRPITLAPTVPLPHAHAADVARAILNAATQRDVEGRTYNLCGDPVSPYGVLRAWRDVRGAGGLTLPVPVPISIRFNDDDARREIGFAPRSIHEGLVDCVAWYESLQDRSRAT